MTQERMDSSDGVRKVTTDSYVSDIDDTLSRASNTLNKVHIMNGANEMYADYSGKTVGHARKALREVFNIAADATAKIGGKDVADDFILEGGMNLEFSKEAGSKGFQNDEES